MIETKASRTGVGKGNHPLEPLLNYEQAASELRIPVRSLRDLVYKGVVPVIRTGHRSAYFRRSEIERALKKRTVKEVGK